jgi:hypothetical protein
LFYFIKTNYDRKRKNRLGINGVNEAFQTKPRAAKTAEETF